MRRLEKLLEVFILERRLEKILSDIAACHDDAKHEALQSELMSALDEHQAALDALKVGR